MKCPHCESDIEELVFITEVPSIDMEETVDHIVFRLWSEHEITVHPEDVQKMLTYATEYMEEHGLFERGRGMRTITLSKLRTMTTLCPFCNGVCKFKVGREG